MRGGGAYQQIESAGCLVIKRYRNPNFMRQLKNSHVPVTLRPDFSSPDDIFKPSSPTHRQPYRRCRQINLTRKNHEAVSLTCWSTPTASRPVYMMFTHPSRDERTKSDIRAFPKSSKLYFRFIHTLPGLESDRQSVLFLTPLMCSPSQ